MNNQIPYFMPNQPINNQAPDITMELDRIVNKINRLEKNMRILDNRINILEKKGHNFNSYNDDPTDMYMI